MQTRRVNVMSSNCVRQTRHTCYRKSLGRLEQDSKDTRIKDKGNNVTTRSPEVSCLPRNAAENTKHTLNNTYMQQLYLSTECWVQGSNLSSTSHGQGDSSGHMCENVYSKCAFDSLFSQADCETETRYFCRVSPLWC